MDSLPSLLPKDLISYGSAENEEELLNFLKQRFPDFLRFFEVSLDDQTWSIAHETYIKGAVEYLYRLFLEDRLDLLSEQKVAKLFFEYYDQIAIFLDRDILLTCKDRSEMVNGLLLSAISPVFRDIIKKGCQENLQRPLSLAIDKSHVEIYPLILEMAQKGCVEHLWRYKEEELWQILGASKDMSLTRLFEETEKVLIRYVSKENALVYLNKSEALEGRLLKKVACHILNEKFSFHVSLDEDRQEGVAFEFLSFYDQAWEVFYALCPVITHLGASGRLALMPEFLKAIQKAPRLIGIDVHRSLAFSPAIIEMPKKVKELNLSACEWLRGAFLRIIGMQHPQIEKLILKNSTHLGNEAFSEFQSFPYLSSLDLTRCNQLQNEELRIILQACPKLHELVLDECKKINEAGFLEIGRYLSDVYSLSFSKTKISDKAVFEITQKCRHLASLNLTKCPELTEEGIVKALQMAPALKVVYLSQEFSEASNLVLERLLPSLRVIYSNA